jgi:aldehyde dehydrogenase (NAD+)
METRMLIAGERVPAAADEWFDDVNPATGEVIARVARGRDEDADRAVKAARQAFLRGPWAKLDGTERCRLLWSFGEKVRAATDELAALETRDSGKPIRDTRGVDLPMVADCLQYFAGWANKIYGDTVPVRGPFLNYTRREPVGVVGALIPWNFPILMAVWKIAPALAAGNTVVLKPSRETPLSALRLGDLALEAGIPPGVLNVLTGYGSESGMALVRHPGVDKIAFTGGTSTGQEIMREAAGTVKRISLELGGKSPNLIFADADPDKAVRGALAGIFYNQGEICTAGSRLLVEQGAHDSIVERLVEGAKKWPVGDPMDPKTRVGPMVSKAQMETVMRYVEIGRKEARLCAGGERVGGRGYFVQPTIFDRVTPAATIAREEIFGPVLSVIPFKDVDEAVAIANDTEYGLSAGVFTRDIGRAHAVAHRLKAGTVWINTYNVFDNASPFGGYKQSGFGREMGHEAIELYTELKSVWVSLS